jgi:hypothetical protein
MKQSFHYAVLIAKVLSYQHNDVSALWRVAKEVDIVTNTFGGVAVVAYTIHLTGSLDIETGCVNGRGCASGSC